jgi:carnosine N-methyltransferase
VLHSVHREWSADGQAERDAVFLPLLNALKRHLPVRGPEMVYRQRVLIPGCGAGRLPLEVSKLGYSAEGNEFSAYMIMASSFMLNGVESSEQYIIYPFLDKVHNLVGVSDSTRPIPVPDASACEDLMGSPFYDLFSSWMNGDDDGGNIDDSDSKGNSESKAWAAGSATRARSACLPCRQKSSAVSLWASLPMHPPLGMSAGDFNQIYGQDSASVPQNYDCIMTCFFIDTAPNVIDYLDTIYSALRPGGVWINLGPLLFHWTCDEDGNGDERYEQSLELSYEELKHAISEVGLEIVEEARENVTYSRDPRSISYTVFDALFFVARKPPLRRREARYEHPIPSLEDRLPRSTRPLPSASESPSPAVEDGANP